MTINQGYEMVGLSEVRPHPRNPRKGDVRAVAESIEENGFFGAIVVQRSTGHILAGNHRWMAASERGDAEIPTIWVDVDDERALKILLADNRTSDLGTYDDAQLAEILSKLSDEVGLEGTGYDETDLEALIGDIQLIDHPSDSDGRASMVKTEATKLVVASVDVKTLERALKATGETNRAQALLRLAEAYLGTQDGQ